MADQGHHQRNGEHPTGQFGQQGRAAVAIQPADAEQHRAPQGQHQFDDRLLVQEDRCDAQQAVAQRHQHQHQPRQVVQPMDHTLQVGQPLAQAEATGLQRPLG